MNLLKAILFGIIEGITEWMPISSTAHMKILNVFLPLDVSPEFYEVFEVVIQLGAILALLLVFWNKIWPFGQSKYPLGEGILSYVKSPASRSSCLNSYWKTSLPSSTKRMR